MRKKKYSTQSRTSNSTVTYHNNYSNYIPKQHNSNKQMLLESMLDNGDKDQK